MAKREAKPGSERDVQRRAILWLRKEGWLVINTSGTWRSARGMAGFPDMLCIYRGAVVFVEVKGFDKKELRPTQQKFYGKLLPHSQGLGTTRYQLVNNDNFITWQAIMKHEKTREDFEHDAAPAP